ncbi:Hsp70 family protein [Actinophytocola sp.]|uniref:Hsp70 family protein n=1 Tax=Actinophytocola sp. TaxID=1872138 RepID=UPI002D321296|nr:Hsp70 family protein [Actinophytocola sp.]HYQ62641.1 Hsp70 family protein [Actinophytocola sp.]
MPYALGVDLGSARTVAAVSRNHRDSWSEPEVVPLDPAATAPGVASVLYLTSDDAVEVGEAAIHAGAAEPERVARDFLDRIGDEVPLALGDRYYPAEMLAAVLVAWVADRVEEHEGTPASQLVVTHPVGWGVHRRTVLQSALRDLNLPELTLLPRPVAAAEAYAATERLEVGQEIGVYSLGASRFEAAVLRRGAFGFELRGHADSVDVLGGTLFDDMVAEHAAADLGELPADPAGLAALRASCVEAKERLSTAVAVTIPTPPGSKKATVLLNRSDFDTMVRPVVEHTVRILQQAIQGSGADSDALRAVVLVGGSGHVPLIAELVTAAVRVRVAAADDPVTAIARGAALAGGKVAKPTVRAQPLPVTPTVTPAEGVTAHTDLMRFDDLGPDAVDIGPPPPRPPVELAPLDPPARGLARLTRRTRAGTEVDELDRDRYDDLDDRAGRRRDRDPDESPRRRRRPTDHEDDE